MSPIFFADSAISNDVWLTIVATLAMLVGFVSIVFICACCKRKKKRNREYSRTLTQAEVNQDFKNFGKCEVEKNGVEGSKEGGMIRTDGSNEGLDPPVIPSGSIIDAGLEHPQPPQGQEMPMVHKSLGKTAAYEPLPGAPPLYNIGPRAEMGLCGPPGMAAIPEHVEEHPMVKAPVMGPSLVDHHASAYRTFYKVTQDFQPSAKQNEQVKYYSTMGVVGHTGPPMPHIGSRPGSKDRGVVGHMEPPIPNVGNRRHSKDRGGRPAEKPEARHVVQQNKPKRDARRIEKPAEACPVQKHEAHPIEKPGAHPINKLEASPARRRREIQKRRHHHQQQQRRPNMVPKYVPSHFVS